MAEPTLVAPEATHSNKESGNFFERIGLTEILGHIFPGAIALCSLLIWGTPDATQILGKDLAKSEIVVGAVVLIFAYACGLVISMWSLSGAEAYRRSFRPPSPKGLRGSIRFLRQWIAWRWLRMTVGLPETAAFGATMDAYLAIRELLERVYGLGSMVLLQQLGDQLTVFRALASDAFKDRVSGIVSEAETLHRRILFALGVALALLFLAYSAAGRLLVTGAATLWGNKGLHDWHSQHPVSTILLAAVIGGSLYVSFKLRRVAAQCWDRELVLTLSIARVFGPQF
jgi:hypothetical protein